MTIYVFDTSALIIIFRHYYRGRFPSLWEKFDAMVDKGAITSTKEVKSEVDSHFDAAEKDDLKRWCGRHPEIFPAPSRGEGEIVSNIFREKHFRQQVIKKQKQADRKFIADPFVIARAGILKKEDMLDWGCVVTMEKYSPNTAKIPNICKRFDIECINLEGFMEREDWKF